MIFNVKITLQIYLNEALTSNNKRVGTKPPVKFHGL